MGLAGGRVMVKGGGGGGGTLWGPMFSYFNVGLRMAGLNGYPGSVSRREPRLTTGECGLTPN